MRKVLSAEGLVVIRPTIRAKAGELILSSLTIALCVGAMVLDWYTWLAGAVALGMISLLSARKWFPAVLVPLAVAGAGKYLGLATLSVAATVIAILEVVYLIIYVRSIKYYFKEDGLVISIEFPLYSKTRSIPKSSIAEVAVESSVAGKILGYANVIVKLRSGEEVVISGVPKKAAQELKKLLFT
ncbi:MAG: PH domain-containing protein [Crenarchaeota archaeon]|nr:PH domain-containing protein [Thermoproteota archaeon]